LRTVSHCSPEPFAAMVQNIKSKPGSDYPPAS
jgi:hypothetical protein